MTESITNLFDRVPERVFRPLGAVDHSRRNWLLLSHLYNDFFAPEADPPDGEGWTQKRVTASIERFLQRWDDEHGADPEELATPLNVRAHGALKMLIESEWLSIDRVGFTQFIIMRLPERPTPLPCRTVRNRRKRFSAIPLLQKPVIA